MFRHVVAVDPPDLTGYWKYPSDARQQAHARARIHPTHPALAVRAAAVHEL